MWQRVCLAFVKWSIGKPSRHYNVYQTWIQFNLLVVNQFTYFEMCLWSQHLFRYQGLDACTTVNVAPEGLKRCYQFDVFNKIQVVKNDVVSNFSSYLTRLSTHTQRTGGPSRLRLQPSTVGLASRWPATPPPSPSGRQTVPQPSLTTFPWARSVIWHLFVDYSHTQLWKWNSRKPPMEEYPPPQTA